MTSKYGGQLLYATRDEHGPIEVVEVKQKLRSLHFGNKTQQAAMFLYNPILLLHKYTQAMLTSLCWQTPKRVLALGLGGGSIPKFLLHHYQQIHIDVVELRPQVTRIAAEYFSLYEDPRLSIHHGRAEDFLATTTHDARYDLILVDLFLTANEKDIAVDISQQLNTLDSLLSLDGTLCMNVIGNNIEQFAGLAAMRQVFAGRLYGMAVDRSNIVLLATNHVIPPEEQINFTALEKRLNLPFRQYYDQLIHR
ncbi:MAG: hypothetical protein EP315_08230 [Gammaproteobacteria bacterium]|nr:MAG: hypothetical protein EP315_08230 [Gammaproteobacteria bacterium]